MEFLRRTVVKVVRLEGLAGPFLGTQFVVAAEQLLLPLDNGLGDSDWVAGNFPDWRRITGMDL